MPEKLSEGIKRAIEATAVGAERLCQAYPEEPGTTVECIARAIESRLGPLLALGHLRMHDESQYEHLLAEAQK